MNTVHIIPWDELRSDAWHSYWASLTFAIQPTPSWPRPPVCSMVKSHAMVPR